MRTGTVSVAPRPPPTHTQAWQSVNVRECVWNSAGSLSMSLEEITAYDSRNSDSSALVLFSSVAQLTSDLSVLKIISDAW